MRVEIKWRVREGRPWRELRSGIQNRRPWQILILVLCVHAFTNGEIVLFRKGEKICPTAFRILHPFYKDSVVCKGSCAKLQAWKNEAIAEKATYSHSTQWLHPCDLSKWQNPITGFLKPIPVTNCAISSYLTCLSWRLMGGPQCTDLWQKYKRFLHFFLLTSFTSWRTRRLFVWFGGGSLFTNGWRAIKI